MVLVDTSVWIDHLRKGEPALVRLLEDDQVFGHRWVTGELALGSLKDRNSVLEMLDVLPKVEAVPETEVMNLIDRRGLFQRGIGWVDAQLLAACVARPCRLWTKDKRLSEIAAELGVAWEPVAKGI